MDDFGTSVELVLLALAFHIFIACQFGSIAKQKGYDGRYGWWVFLTSIIGMLMVIALPDRNANVAVKNAVRVRAEETPKTHTHSQELPAIRVNNFKKGNYNVDDVVSFGDYHGEIEWLVLDKQDGKALLISKYALDAKPYNYEYTTNVIWESCTLRAWLNGEFINEAFSGEEKGLILDAYLTNADEYGTDGGNDTTDKVFLLSIDEAEKYFADEMARRCAPTEYAKEQGSFVSNEYKTESGEAACWWWLRSPGVDQYCAAYVRSGGSIDYYGFYVDGIDDAELVAEGDTDVEVDDINAAAEIEEDDIPVDDDRAHYGFGCVRPALWVRCGE